MSMSKTESTWLSWFTPFSVRGDEQPTTEHTEPESAPEPAHPTQPADTTPEPEPNPVPEPTPDPTPQTDRWGLTHDDWKNLTKVREKQTEYFRNALEDEMRRTFPGYE